ncbi:MAG TPA: hypothetical protein VKB18_07200 [Gemmatimonadota bacterium]|nr:hypothetical protein [Gemmatimonadota bacterium]
MTRASASSTRRSRRGTSLLDPADPGRILCAAAAAALLLLVPGRPAAGQGAGSGGGGAAAAFDASTFHGLHYRWVGPSRGGRVTTVTGVRQRPGTFYMGSTGGGIWKTEDYGRSWRNVSDGYLSTPSLGAITVAPSDPDVVYAGTGSDGIRSNVITGRGIWRSSDAGKTWSFLGLRDVGQIGAVEVDPRDPDRVWVAALGHPFGPNPDRGVYRSTDGGGHREKVLFVSDSVGAIDLELNPADPDVVYAAAWRGQRKPWTIISGCASSCGDGVWKSTDGGDHWRRVLTGEDFPGGLIGKIDLAVSPAAPDRVYALVEARRPARGLYRSDDRGETWRLVSTEPGLLRRPFYYTNVTADPTDADVVYVNDEGFYRSADGGETFERRSTPHGDNHDMWIDPSDPDVFIQSNDGGANVTLDGGKSWSSQDNQPTAELYQVDLDDRFPYWLYAGQQDNTTIAVPSLPPARSAPAGPTAWWEETGGCETGPAVPRPGDPDIVYANCKGRFGRYSRVDGQEESYPVGAEFIYGADPEKLEYRFQRTVPIEVSPTNPDVVYDGSQYVHRTTDGGRTWERISPDLTAHPPSKQVRSGEPITPDLTGEEYFSTLYVIEASPHDSSVIWAGSNDGLVHVTRDGGESWTDVTPPELPKWGRINAIEISPHRAGKAYVAAYRWLLDDWTPYVYRTTDYGRSWTRIADGTRGIPVDDPVRVVREDPERAGLLFAGTEFGMYVSFDDGASWKPLQRDLPRTPVTDIEIRDGDLALSTMGRGFWILDDLEPLRAFGAPVAQSPAHLFSPRPAVRMRYRRPGGYGGPGPADPEFPAPGAAIDYWLGRAPDGPVTLEILDDSGRVVRGFSSSEDGYVPPASGTTADPSLARIGGRERPGVEPGMHRFTWDMRYPGPVEPENLEGGAYGRPTGRGPLAAPGSYGVRLVVDGDTARASFELRIDPRVRADGTTAEDLAAQLALNRRIRDVASRARLVASRLVRTTARVDTALAEGSGPASELRALRVRLQAVADSVLTPGDVAYPRPMLLDQVDYLYGMTTSADQRPGRDAYDRLETLAARTDRRASELAKLEARADELLGR